MSPIMTIAASSGGAIDPRSGQAFLETGRGLPVVPTAGVTFEF
jgi:hypothetical protein